MAKIFEQNEPERAIIAYKNAITLKKDYANAHYNLAELYKFTGKRRDAIREFELYLKYNPDAEDAMEVKKKIVSLI